MPLETELEYFKKHREEWLEHHEGKYVLVVGQNLVGAFDDAESAYEAGLQQFGNVPMLVKQLRGDSEDVVFFPALTSGLIDART